MTALNVKPRAGGGILGAGKPEPGPAGVTFRLNEGEVIKGDIQCINGVIHVVDTLLNPYLFYRYLV